MIPDLAAVIPDPVAVVVYPAAVIPDAIYLVTTLELRQGEMREENKHDETRPALAPVIAEILLLQAFSSHVISLCSSHRTTLYVIVVF